MNVEIPEAKRPKSREWRLSHKVKTIRGFAQAYTKGKLLALSECTIAVYPDSEGVGPQWLVSFSVGGKKRIDGKELRRALANFDMADAEEDNHHPGVARHFWKPVDPAHRVECQCKSDETLVVDSDGYTWSNAREGLCRGCEYEALIGKPCPIHKRQGGDHSC